MRLETMYYQLFGSGLLVLGLALFLVLAGAFEIGFRFGHRHGIRKARSEGTTSAVAVLTGGMLTLMAFLLGLTVSFGQGRFEARRELVAVEANTIGTAWLRARLVGGPEGDAIAKLIEGYAQTRLAFTQADPGGGDKQVARSGELQDQMWVLATSLARRAPTPVTASLVAALNEMIDASLTQRFAFESRTPPNIMLMLVLGAAVAIGALGFQLGVGGERQLLLSALLVAMLVAGIDLTADLSSPRMGSLRVDARPLIWTIKGFHTPSPAP